MNTSFALSLAPLALLTVMGGVARADLAQDLQGEWSTGFMGDADGFVQQRQRLTFTGETCKLALDALIEHPLGQGGVRAEMPCRWRLGGASASVAGASELDLEFLTQTITPLTPSMVTDWNEERYCGYTDWRVGQPKDVTGRDCDGDTFQAGSRSYDLVRLQDGKLNLGDMPGHSPFNTPGTRPTALDLTRTFCRPGASTQGCGGTGGEPTRDVLTGFYAVASHTENRAGCDAEGPADASFAHFEIYANRSVVVGVPGWSLQTCATPEACRAQQNTILLGGDWPLHEETATPDVYKGRSTETTFAGRCHARLLEAKATRAADGSLRIESRVYEGDLDAADGDACTAAAHAAQGTTPGFRCTRLGVLSAKRL